VPCTQSIGRDLSNEARIGQPRSVAQKCELVHDNNRLACMQGLFMRSSTIRGMAATQCLFAQPLLIMPIARNALKRAFSIYGPS
jgi:hypothetical protein